MKFAGPLPRACQIIRGEALWILTSTFHFYHFCFIFWIFCNRNQLKQPFSSNFSKPEPWTRNRATIRARAIVSSLSYAHARRRPWEPSHTGIVGGFSTLGSPIFEAISAAVLVWKMVPNRAQMASKLSKNLVKNNTWNEVHKTFWKCAKVDTLGLARNAFSNGKVATNH